MAAIITQKLSLTINRFKLAGIFHLEIQRASTCSALKKGYWLLRLENVRMICSFFEPLLHEVNEWSESSIESDLGMQLATWSLYLALHDFRQTLSLAYFHDSGK